MKVYVELGSKAIADQIKASHGYVVHQKVPGIGDSEGGGVVREPKRS